MKCPYCKNDMHIVSQFFRTESGADGGTDIYSVVDLMCTDPQCPNGKKGVPTARQARLVHNADTHQNSITCCGQPLVYFGETGYWLPGGAAALRRDDTLAVTCPQCGQQHTADVAGKEEVL